MAETFPGFPRWNLPMAETFPVPVGKVSPYGKKPQGNCREGFPYGTSRKVTAGKETSYGSNLPGNCREGFFLWQKPMRNEKRTANKTEKREKREYYN
jgi:hypothetical protein